MQLEKDLKFGLSEEKKVIIKLENYFNIKLKQNTLYSTIDFENENYLFELKSRRINHNQYYTAFISKNKIDYFEKSKKQCYVVWNYLDGIFYLKYEKELFKKFKITEDTIKKDNIEKTTLNYKIPYKYLIKMV